MRVGRRVGIRRRVVHNPGGQQPGPGHRRHRDRGGEHYRGGGKIRSEMKAKTETLKTETLKLFQYLSFSS
jgi:hypothetical protein